MWEYQATVNRVIDGDSIEVTVDLGFRLSQVLLVRLFGINTPETNSKDEGERLKAQQAKKCLESMLPGKQLLVKTVKPKDKYGRWLAEIWLPGLQLESVNTHLLNLGLAKPWDGQGEKPV